MDMEFHSFLPISVIWVPCIPDYSAGTYVPIYNIEKIPEKISKGLSSLPRGGQKTKPWSHSEDDKLKELVEDLGIKKWSKIALALNKSFGNKRKGKNCRERWNNHLDSKINKGEWSYTEDLELLHNFKALGHKWSCISKQLPGRTENSVKNRWNTLMKSTIQVIGKCSEQEAAEYLISHINSIVLGN
jgi:Myb-like DNA-binding domain